jgi:hypothetical protein
LFGCIWIWILDFLCHFKILLYDFNNYHMLLYYITVYRTVK